ncbi:MAG: GTPase Era [Desulfomicrobiaceae bacterium]|jgi:GTP-binding protein Era|nr:GTPase Era [Desulfomicrobiaceae bacterium]MDI3493320.1 GTPase [Desulfomicrobiaceae bacterium]MDK2873693.1 GTPase [Desulfomicrobiaceae bacterium]HCF05700.1 GTPase Era [Desulfomicrobiaceae bacterium]
MENSFRSGYVALVGPPNAGKSTFLNGVLGEKLAIVSPKPGTTRTAITGIWTTDSAQVVFLDTPGIVAARGRMNRLLADAAWAALGSAHGAVVFLDGARYAARSSALARDVHSFAPRLRQLGMPLAVAVNKIDQVSPKARLLAVLAACADLWPGVDIFPLSARTGEGRDRLEAAILAMLPEGPPLFPPDQLSTAPLRFLVAEIVREQLFVQLRQELPYHVAVEVEEWDESPELTSIGVVIYVSKTSHKAMIIGRGGSRLKAVGQAARQALKELLGGKVHLSTWVKVREGWTEDEGFLREMNIGEVL